MSIIDKQRISAVALLESLGYTFSIADGWTPRSAPEVATVLAEADAMHALLVSRADKLEVCTEGSDEAIELEHIADTASERVG
jgi:hypothetical protein